MNIIHRSTIKRYRSSAWENVCAASDDIPADFARLLRDEVRPLQIAYQRLMSSVDGHPAGIECRMNERESWAFALPDASGAKEWRVQQFDQDGFIGHMCFDSLPEAVEDMLRMGYVVTDPGALDRVGSTAGWTQGIRRAAIMQKHQEGLITYRQMVDEIDALAD
ncbi:hypothetical protein QYH69_21980 [Paraburkholderia sp. SARCC-3016]|uniref:hypothetical protein n=1 Tax=Paraburkholderia sp. SARCC-3016 TaxID=3058611 RepID=UPI00280880F9|nr:hypothetical protein [Paraburkholderia sp. SARCC-3016]MDQ7979913.1 hypothetical protein [Paraburkholderia sp. SARCC-3016]